MQSKSTPFLLVLGGFLLLLTLWYTGQVAGGSLSQESPLATGVNSPYFLTQEADYNARLQAGLIPTEASYLPTPTPTPVTYPANEEGTLYTYQGSSVYQIEPLFRLTYGTRRWVLADDALHSRHWASCKIELRFMGVARLGPMTETTIELAGYAWLVRHFPAEQAISYFLYTPDGDSYGFEIRYDPAMSANQVERCRISTEWVLNTFTLVPADAAEWNTYIDVTGVAVEYPLGWQARPSSMEGSYFPPPADEGQAELLRQSITIELIPLALANQGEADPAAWLKNGNDAQPHWQSAIHGNRLDGWLFAWGNDNFDGGNPNYGLWFSDPQLVALFYDPQCELEIKVTTSFDDESTLVAQQVDLPETVAQRYPIFDHVINNLHFVATDPRPKGQHTVTFVTLLPILALSTPPPPTIYATGTVMCRPTAQSFYACHDHFLGFQFMYPKAWGSIATQFYTAGLDGNYYNYRFSGSYQVAGGRGQIIVVAGRGRMLTDFAGYQPDQLEETCQTYSAAFCEELQPGVLVMLQKADAASICTEAGMGTPGFWAFVAVNLPNHPQITGMIFPLSLYPAAVQAELDRLLDHSDLITDCVDAAKRAAFDQRIDQLFGELDGRSAAAPTEAWYQPVLQFAQAIVIDP